MRSPTPTLTLLTCAALAFSATPARACTLFVLTDGTRTLFFNNEDWFNRTTRLWFVPAGQDHLGCAYVGFDNGWAQGGLNTAGLAFDWVAGFDGGGYTPAPDLEPVRGNPAERMLESCRTVDEAIAFFRTHREPDFARSRILISDATGASVAIGARNGQLHFVKRTDHRGFGYGEATLVRELPKKPAPTVEAGAAILRACRQPGDGGTKYATVYDLNARTLHVFPDLDAPPVTLDLAAELAKGPHTYDIPKLRAQLAQPPRPLHPNQRRFYLDTFKPSPTADAALTARLRRLVLDAADGKFVAADFTPELWAQLSPRLDDLQADIRRLGDLRSLTPVADPSPAPAAGFLYLAEFGTARALYRYHLDAENRIARIQTEALELNPALVAAPPR